MILNGRDLLKQIKAKSGMKRKDIVAESQIGDSLYGNIQGGINEPRYATMVIIANACGYELKLIRKENV